MAAAFDAKPTAYNSSDGLNQEAIGATSVSAASGFTIGASATLLIGQIAFGNGANVAAPTNVTMTWDGASMTQEIITSSTSMPDTATSAQFSKATPATGAKTLAAAWTTAQDCYLSAASFTGAQIDVTGTTSNTQATSLSINTTSDGATIACFAVNGSTPTVSQTKIWAEAPNNPGGGGSYAIGGSGTNAHGFTGAGGTRQVITGLKITATAGSSSVVPVLMRQYRQRWS
jgi:hypothetical protein